jgi:4'-phosphopantetheinyl transferase
MLAADEIHIWRIALDRPNGVLERLERLLHEDEIARADRFRRPELRSRFVIGRGALRCILGGYLEVEPEHVAFRLGPHGKPYLEGMGRPLQFNLSHSDDLALCACLVDREVGIDVERLRPLGDAGRIIDRYFSPAERAEFLSFPEPERLAAFYRGWTRKEAFLKATGEGIASALDRFDVSLSAREAVVLRVGQDRGAALRWVLQDLEPATGFQAALAVEGPIGRVCTWSWMPVESA